jgi:hypothetical protein
MGQQVTYHKEQARALISSINQYDVVQSFVSSKSQCTLHIKCFPKPPPPRGRQGKPPTPASASYHQIDSAFTLWGSLPRCLSSPGDLRSSENVTAWRGRPLDAWALRVGCEATRTSQLPSSVAMRGLPDSHLRKCRGRRKGRGGARVCRPRAERRRGELNVFGFPFWTLSLCFFWVSYLACPNLGILLMMLLFV